VKRPITQMLFCY